MLFSNFRVFNCGCCGTSNTVGIREKSINGYRIICEGCVNKMLIKGQCTSKRTARDSALAYKDDKNNHRYSFILILHNVNVECALNLLANYRVAVNGGRVQFEEMNTTRQLAKICKNYNDYIIIVNDNLTHTYTTVDNAKDATDIQSYDMGYKFHWIDPKARNPKAR